MPTLKFVQPLSEALKEQLYETYKNHPSFVCRQRAQAILLSNKGYTINQLQQIFEVDRDTISIWINRFEASGIEGLSNLPGSGRKPIYTDEEINQLKELIDKEPRQIKQAQVILQEKTGKTSSRDTLKRILKKLNYSWHRCRRSLKSKRNQDEFDKEMKNQGAMEMLAAEEKINLYYFDESGFTTIPSVPYAWQPIGEVRELPSFQSKRLNVLGFMSNNQKAYFHSTEGNVNTEQVITAFDDFTSMYAIEYASHNKPCIVVLDNASFHTSYAFEERIDEWGARGVILHVCPPTVLN